MRGLGGGVRGECCVGLGLRVGFGEGVQGAKPPGQQEGRQRRASQLVFKL